MKTSPTSEAARLLGQRRSAKKTAAARANGQGVRKPLLAVRPTVGGPRRIQSRKEEEGGFSVRVPSLPGCYSQGETREEAIVNITEAIELHIEALQANRFDIPEDPAFRTE